MAAQSAEAATVTASATAQHTGASGRIYRFEKLLQEREHLGRVWVAEAEGKRYILKDLPEAYFNGFSEHVLPRLKTRQHPNVRLPCDTISNQRTVVYDHLTHDFLTLAQQDLTPQARKQVLKAVLQGLVELHDKDIVHLDLKPDNVMVDCSEHAGILTIGKVQLTDFENALPLEPGSKKFYYGALTGNENWRSPEGHLAAKIGKPTDIFAFGIMCIYAMLGKIVFAKDSDYEYQESQGNPGPLILMQRQLSYFGDDEGFKALAKLVKRDGLLHKLLTASWEQRDSPKIPYKHFSTWPEVEDDVVFKDIVLKMTNLDQRKRPTAREVLQHAWFSDVQEMGDGKVVVGTASSVEAQVE
ncbi:serine/threonine protein kinase [Neohortaea acidophila]|uniref:Serine/threonine protein kinase n=1 Tax=Neohortaea acidophila TaxID=245834 RepID=A0A6A6Q3C5_9PEZI|nr:serine/threonine protein kinase [Neohortaea acidophila]KAF2486785.1 serine/threonine protein kinase [Neohortaea acidophila]